MSSKQFYKQGFKKRVPYAKYQAMQRAKVSAMISSKRKPVIYTSSERKYFDIDNATYAVNTTGSFTPLCLPVLGSDFTNRVGRKVVIKSVYIRGRVQLDAATAASNVASLGQQARFVIFVDNQPNGAAPAVTDVLKEAVPHSQLNANNRDRFRIIKDKTYVFDPMIISNTATQAHAVMNRTVYDVKVYKKLNIETIFNGTNGGTIADVNSGALYMFWIGNVAAGTTDATAPLTTRVRFDDS